MAITVTVNGGSPITISQQSVSPVNVSIVGATGPAGATGADGAAGQGVPAGGVEGQVILKQSATDYDTAWDYVESVYAPIENNEGSTMSAGTPVYAKGISGNRILVGVADANDSAKMPAIGVLLEETADGATGEIITAGLFNKTVSGLTGVSVGQTVYVSNTGTLTNTKPTASTDLVQNIGVVLQTNGSNIQKMKVSAIDRVNDIPNLASGVFFIGGATGQLSPYTLPIADGGANQFLKTDGAGAVTFESITQATGNELENVVEDTTPQLGGTLDSNGNAIRLRGTGHTNYVAISPSPLEPSSNVTFVLPIADGSNGQVLQTNGSGRLSFVDRATVGKSLTVACSDETSDLTTGAAKATFRMPEAATITGVRASVTTAPVGSALTVDINESGTTILSTKLTIDAGEKTSTTAATAAVISDTSIADDAEMTIDIDAIGSSTAGAGLKVTIYYNPA